MRIDKPTLVSRVAKTLRESMQHREYVGELPSLRLLARQLGVSIPTLRAAERVLAQEGLLSLRQGKTVTILGSASARKRTGSSRRVGIIYKEYLENHHFLFALESLLHQADYTSLRFRETRLLLAGRGERLRRLLADAPVDHWLLISSSEVVQKQAQDLGANTFLIGSNFPGIEIPSIDIAQKAIGRHAASLILRESHSSIGLLLPARPAAGDDLTLAGFRLRMAETDARLTEFPCSPDSEDLLAQLKKAFRQAERPTAFFSLRKNFSLAALTWMLREGISVPGEITLLNRDYCELLAACSPSIGGYRVQETTQAERAIRSALNYFESGQVKTRHARIFPEFVPGETLSRSPRPSPNRLAILPPAAQKSSFQTVAILPPRAKRQASAAPALFHEAERNQTGRFQATPP